MDISREGNRILEKTRKDITGSAKGDADKWFKLNRWVFARLQEDERKTKRDLKKKLIRKVDYCGHCGKKFNSKKFIDIHRINKDKAYSEDNCILVHNGKCHQEAESKHNYARVFNKKLLLKKSKRYDNYGNTLYWWDITDNEKFKYIKRENGIIVFQEADTETKHSYHYQDLAAFLTSDRKTTRNRNHNWGFRILKSRVNKLASEPGAEDKTWKYIELK